MPYLKGIASDKRMLQNGMQLKRMILFDCILFIYLSYLVKPNSCTLRQAIRNKKSIFKV